MASSANNSSTHVGSRLRRDSSVVRSGSGSMRFSPSIKPRKCRRPNSYSGPHGVCHQTRLSCGPASGAKVQLPRRSLSLSIRHEPGQTLADPFSSRRRRSKRRRRRHVEAREGRDGGEQVPHVAGSAGGGDGELRRQHGRQEPLHHLRQGHQGQAQPVAVRLRGRHGHGHRQEGEARPQEEGHARRHRPPAQAVAPQGRSLHVLRR